MSVEYLFRNFGQKCGLRPSEDTERVIIADYVNQAARMLYKEAEIPELIKETTATGTADSILVLPSTVGHIRAMRENVGRWVWTLRDAFNKYKFGEQNAGLWFSWLVKGHYPMLISNYAISGGDLAINTTAEDAALDVTIVGSTVNQSRYVLTQNFGSASIYLLHPNPFTSIYEIRKNKQTAYDVTITDSVLGNLAVIPNNQLQAKYYWVDVSKYPSQSSVGSVVMDVLYKEAYQYLYNDQDVFAGDNYDDAIIQRALGVWAEDNNRTDEALLRDRKASREMSRNIANEDRGELQLAKVVPNTHDTLIPRNYTFRNRARIRRGSYGH